jgi:hypothetical protein
MLLAHGAKRSLGCSNARVDVGGVVDRHEGSRLA